MRKFSKSLIQIITASGYNQNQISKISGISNAYLTKLLKGNINRPGKDKIASILLALHYSITHINYILSEYDYMPLNHHDIPEILNNNRRRRFEGRILPQFDHIYFELLMAALENLGGTKIIIKHRPSGIFIPLELYMKKEFPTEADTEAEAFNRAFTHDVVAERKALFLENCRRGQRFETYICRDCLEDSLNRNLGSKARDNDPGHIKLLARYYANAAAALMKFPEQHIHRIVKRCSIFHFLIQDADGSAPKISFTGRRAHDLGSDCDQLTLDSFLSDNQAIVDLFMDEVKRCRSSLDTTDGRHTPKGFHAYLRAIFYSYGHGEVFDEAFNELMVNPEYSFH